jgi:uncharacterized DUF497 family protein
MAAKLLTTGTHHAICQIVSDFDWDDEKNDFLQKTRGVGFEDVVFHIQNGNVMDIIRHPNASRYPNQNIIVVDIEGYIYLVPYVKGQGTRFLKTIIPSRRATKEYLK